MQKRTPLCNVLRNLLPSVYCAKEWSLWFVLNVGSPPGVWVRVSGGHLCEAEAPTEAAAETVACVSYDGGVVTS